MKTPMAKPSQPSIPATAYFWWPSFGESTQPHGGGNRSLQIAELLSEHGIAFAKLDTLHRAPWPSLCRALVGRSLATGQLPSRFPGGLTRFALDYQMIRERLPSQPNIEAVVWESTYEPKTAALLQRLSKRLIAVPQNIESLVPGRVSSRRSIIRRLQQELGGYQNTTAVFTISEDEAWLLRMLGIRARVLPYFPPRELTARLLEIRRQRQATDQANQVLLFGSHRNPPTRLGTQEVLQLLAPNYPSDNPELLVVGNASEGAANWNRPERCRVLGRLPDEELDALKIETRALLIHQAPTTGIITRIIEAVLAGIPVIANEDAARGWWGLDGIHVYRNAAELLELLRQPLDLPALPQRSMADEQRFIDVVLGKDRLS
jgi:hypothetical protein